MLALLDHYNQTRIVIKNDIWIAKKAQEGMIVPFESSLIREIKNSDAGQLQRVISYGLSSYGYGAIRSV